MFIKEKKEKVFMFRLTEQELITLEDYAEEKSLSVSDFVRKKIFVETNKSSSFTTITSSQEQELLLTIFHMYALLQNYCVIEKGEEFVDKCYEKAEEHLKQWGCV